MEQPSFKEIFFQANGMLWNSLGIFAFKVKEGKIDTKYLALVLPSLAAYYQYLKYEINCSKQPKATDIQYKRDTSDPLQWTMSDIVQKKNELQEQERFEDKYELMQSIKETEDEEAKLLKSLITQVTNILPMIFGLAASFATRRCLNIYWK